MSLEGTPYGKVLMSVGYHNDKEVVELELIQANKLPALDSSGTLHIYIYIYIVTFTAVWLYIMVKCFTVVLIL